MVLKINKARAAEPDLTDSDNPEWTAEDFARAVGPEGLSAAELAAFPKTKVGRPKSADPKIAISVRLDSSVVRDLKATGPGWQTRMNDMIKASLAGPTTGRAAMVQKATASMHKRAKTEAVDATDHVSFGPKRAAFGERLKKGPNAS